jgi:ATP dependent DNA ligase C terminal region
MDKTPTIPSLDESLAEDELAIAVTSLDEPADNGMIAPDWTGPRCEKCHAPIKTKLVEVCRSCGWYARLGTYLEVDPDWETEDELNQAPPQLQPSHVEVWMSLLPRWAWVIITTVALVVAESVVVRLVTPADSWIRTAWSFAQLLAGTLTFFVCHIFSFLVQAADDADMNVQDLLIRPLKVWKQIVRELPQRLSVVNVAAAGLTAALMSVVVIGGLHYERLLDWGFEQPKKQNLMGAMVSQMQKAAQEKQGDLEDSVKDFAGSQDLDKTPEKQPPTPPPKPRLETDCVILGYRASKDGHIHTLLLGTARGKQLVFAGSVQPHDDEEFAELSKQLVAARTDYPFLDLHADAIWVKPKFTCSVTYTTQSKNGRLLGIHWEKYNGTVSMP